MQTVAVVEFRVPTGCLGWLQAQPQFDGFHLGGWVISASIGGSVVTAAFRGDLMKLRTQVIQALRCCMLMARSPDARLSTSAMADACGLPKDYLAKTSGALARAKIVLPRNGPCVCQLRMQVCDLATMCLKDLVNKVESENALPYIWP
jgi:hypothetical protein